MKISFCMIAFEEALTLRANLEHLYPHAHEIIVCEGSIALLRDELGLPPRSRDGTCDILSSFPDPDRKLRVIQRDWRDKNEMSAAYAEAVTGDLVWHVDADEFYDEYSLKAVPREFDDRSLNTLIVPHTVFWNSPEWVLATATGEERWYRVPRVLRMQKGMNVRHIPVRRLIEGRVDESGMREPRDPKINIWHYAWNDDLRVRTKMTIYSKRDAKTTRQGWVADVWDRWTPNCTRADFPDGVHPAKELRLWPEPFIGQHPPCVRGILANLDVAAKQSEPDALARARCKTEPQAQARRCCVSEPQAQARGAACEGTSSNQTPARSRLGF